MPLQNYVGLFGFASTGSPITNVGLVSETVAGQNQVGGLVGDNWGTVSNSYATGNVTGGSSGTNVGGLVGTLNTGGFVSGSSASGWVTGMAQVGGLVGNNWGTVSNSYATGNVTGSSTGANVGGLVGTLNTAGFVSYSYASGLVTGESQVGGLVGNNWGSVSNSYATGNVTGSGDNVGGLVGFINGGGAVSNSYATGGVTGLERVGGLVGDLYNGTVSNSYAAGPISGGSNLGGLVGASSSPAQVSSSYYDTQATGQTASAGGTPETTTQMMQQATFVGWDFSNTWGIYAGTSYPYLQWSPATPPQTTVYVDPAFTPDATHFNTIQAGINAIAPGGTVCVDAGNYSGESDTLRVNATVVFGSTLSGAVTVGGFTMSIGSVMATGCNLTITGGYSQSGGTFTSSPTSGTFAAGNFSLTGGTFSRLHGRRDHSQPLPHLQRLRPASHGACPQRQLRAGQ